ncbi:MAG: glutamate 5-kinase [Caldilineaceae bacterium]
MKLGTSVLTGGSRHLNRPQMVELTRQCAELHHQGCDVLICTSGAQAAGSAELGFPQLPPTMASKQMLAAVGQGRLMFVWEQLFDIYGIHVGQILLTRADTEDRHRYLNARDAIGALLAHKIVPIVNENDAVVTEEIKVGDNDNLSALVAVLADADLLLLMTDQPGLFTADPRTNPDATLIPEVRTIDESLKQLAGGSKSGLGVGAWSPNFRPRTWPPRRDERRDRLRQRAQRDPARRGRRTGGDPLPCAGIAAGKPQTLDTGRPRPVGDAAGRRGRGVGVAAERAQPAARGHHRHHRCLRARRHRLRARTRRPYSGARHRPLQQPRSGPHSRLPVRRNRQSARLCVWSGGDPSE